MLRPEELKLIATKIHFPVVNKYEESITYHHLSESLIGTTIKMFIEVKNDTLIQKWPVNDAWQLPEKYSLEKYVRLK